MFQTQIIIPQKSDAINQKSAHSGSNRANQIRRWPLTTIGNFMVFEKMSPIAIAEQLGERLKQARLNTDLTQAELASRTGLNRRTILNAEKGNVQLKNLVAILIDLGMVEQINMFLPVQEISPLQLAKIKGKKRQRASRIQKKKLQIREDKSLW